MAERLREALAAYRAEIERANKHQFAGPAAPIAILAGGALANAVAAALADVTGAAADVAAERARQDEKWGEQNHPDGTGEKTTPLVEIVKVAGRSNEVPVGVTHYAFGLALMAKSATDTAARQGRVTWATILLEEVFEALAEADAAKLRAELVQVAAVAQQWVEAIDRRGPAPAQEAE